MLGRGQGGAVLLPLSQPTCQSPHSPVGGLIMMQCAASLLFSLVAFHCGGAAAPQVLLNLFRQQYYPPPVEN